MDSGLIITLALTAGTALAFWSQSHNQTKNRLISEQRKSLRLAAELQGTYIEAPNIRPVPKDKLSLFLGGGISGCPDWQAYVFEALNRTCPHLICFNPRRSKFDVNDTKATPVQIKWEYDHLHQASAIMFWFPSETLCPITLYELGAWTILSQKTGTKIFVGCHPSYSRIEDVKVQTALALGFSIPIATDLNEIIHQIENWYQTHHEKS